MSNAAHGETVQERLYFLQGELQKLANNFPLRYQQRVSVDVLSALAGSMLDGTVFEIVHQLSEIQLMTEKMAFQARQQLLADQNKARQSMLKRHRQELDDASSGRSKDHMMTSHQQQVQQLVTTHQQDLARFDMKVVMQFDQKLTEQQVILEKTGLPVFHVTNEPQEIQLQRHLLAMIADINALQLAPLSHDQAGAD